MHKTCQFSEEETSKLKVAEVKEQMFFFYQAVIRREAEIFKEVLRIKNAK